MKLFQHFVNLLFCPLHSAFACIVQRGGEL
jgi:hypothetical protein